MILENLKTSCHPSNQHLCERHLSHDFFLLSVAVGMNIRLYPTELARILCVLLLNTMGKCRFMAVFFIRSCHFSISYFFYIMELILIMNVGKWVTQAAEC